MLKNNFSLNLKELREKKGLSQTELSKLIGISRSTLSNYESGQSEPILCNIIKLASFFNCSLDEIVFGYNPQIKLDIFNYNSYIDKLDTLSNQINRLNIDKILDTINSLKVDIVSSNETNSSIESTDSKNNNNVIDLFNKLDDRRYEQIIDISNDVNSDTSKLFIRGNVSAGSPNIAFEQNNEYVNVPNKLLCPSKEYFILEVTGDSMNEIYLPGELLLVEKTYTANNGSIVIALIDTDECTLKEYHKINETIYLYPHSTNPSHKVQKYNKNTKPCHIIGVVKNILKGATICEC